MRKIKNYPFKDKFEFDGITYSNTEIIDLLNPILTEERKQAIDEISAKRCRNIAVVTERLHDVGNINAVMRTMEALAYHQLHNIQNEELLATNRITQGADKWLDIINWDKTTECIQELKDNGYKIVVTHLTADAKPITEIDFTSQKTAICFGNERDGISKELLALADENCILPMEGFTQSYNISVASAIALQKIKDQRELVLGKHSDVTSQEREIIKASYYLMSATRPIRLMMKQLKKLQMESIQNES